MNNKKLSSYEKKISEIVENLLNEKKNDNVRDSSFRFLQNYHGEAQHISLRYPGKFVKNLKTETFSFDNRNLTMDAAELVNPDDTLPFKSTINPEQQTTEISPDKTDIMYKYKLQLIFKHGIPALNIVITNIGDKDYIILGNSHGDFFKIYVIVLNDEEISERLNTLKDKIKHKKYLSEIEVLDFAYIMMFAQDEKAKEYSEEVSKLFCEVKYLNPSLQLDIYYVMVKLIRLHFRDDIEKTRELLTMITKAIHPDNFDKLPTLEKMAIEIEEFKKKFQKQNEEFQKQNEEYKKEISLKDEKIRELKNELKNYV